MTQPRQAIDALPVMPDPNEGHDGAAAPMLPYADLPARWGVSVERSDKLVRVVVPPVPGWRHLHKGYFIGFTLLAAYMLGNLVPAIRRGEFYMVLPTVATWGTALAFGVAAAVRRLRQRTVVEVTDTMVS